MTEETKFDNLQPADKEHMDQIKTVAEIPHRELQIQWHEDMLHHLRTGEAMREWEWQNTAGDWVESTRHLWDSTLKYRRKPKMKKVPMWHCVGQNISKPSEFNAFGSMVSRENLIYQLNKSGYELVGAVAQTDVEISEDTIPESA